MSANETLDPHVKLLRDALSIASHGRSAALWRRYTDSLDALIAAVRERDAEIARLKLRNEFLSEALAAAGAIVHAEDQP